MTGPIASRENYSAVCAEDAEMRARAEKAEAQLAALKAQEPTVKALEWVVTGQTGFLQCQHYAISGPLRHTVHPLESEDGPFFEHYDIRRDKNTGRWKLVYWVGNNGLSGIRDDFPRLEVAKAAAQADYETRIRSALVAHPLPASGDRAALVEALQEKAKATGFLSIEDIQAVSAALSKPEAPEGDRAAVVERLSRTANYLDGLQNRTSTEETAITLFREALQEPTPEMLSAVWSLSASNGGAGTRACYAALLAASPLEPTK